MTYHIVLPGAQRQESGNPHQGDADLPLPASLIGIISIIRISCIINIISMISINSIVLSLCCINCINTTILCCARDVAQAARDVQQVALEGTKGTLGKGTARKVGVGHLSTCFKSRRLQPGAIGPLPNIPFIPSGRPRRPGAAGPPACRWTPWGQKIAHQKYTPQKSSWIFSGIFQWTFSGIFQRNFTFVIFGV